MYNNVTFTLPQNCHNKILQIKFLHKYVMIKYISSTHILQSKNWIQDTSAKRRTLIQCESKKSPPCSLLTFFPKRMGIFNQFLTHLLHVPFYTRLQIFIQSPTLTKLCHTKRNQPTNFYFSLEV